MPSPEYALIVALVFIGGFAIQQFLQLIDFLIEVLINRIIDQNGNIWGVSPTVFKKSLMIGLASGLGILAAVLGNIRILSLAFPPCVGTDCPKVDPDLVLKAHESLDFVISGLVIGSGTEAVNTLMKFLGYIKESQKASIIEISINPPSVSIVKGETVDFIAIVRNGNSSEVGWSVVQGNGGTIDESGKYSAPNVKGTFQIRAISKEDNTKIAVSIVTVGDQPV